VASAGASGAVAGVALAIAWTVFRLPPLSVEGTAGIVGVALLGDMAYGVLGHPRPLARHTQVPREWAYLFDMRAAAVLYGSRLGVGPLSLLDTWLWWAAAIAAASHGPAASAVVGAVFGLTRTVVVVGTSRGVEHAMADRMARLRALERAAAPLIGAGTFAACLLALRLT
jgi:hypothetical protein